MIRKYRNSTTEFLNTKMTKNLHHKSYDHGRHRVLCGFAYLFCLISNERKWFCVKKTIDCQNYNRNRGDEDKGENICTIKSSSNFEAAFTVQVYFWLACRACSRSSRISSMASIPTDRRTSSGVTPEAR